MPKVTAVTSFEEFKKIINSDKYTVFDFWATWCGPCRTISPYFEELSDKYGDVEFYKVDVDEQNEIAQEVGIRAMPTFKLFKDGQEVESTMGAVKPNLDTLLAQTKKETA